MCPQIVLFSINKAVYTAALSRAVGQEQQLPFAHLKERWTNKHTDRPTDRHSDVEVALPAANSNYTKLK